MIELASIYDVYKDDTIENRYKFISRMKEFLKTRPNLKEFKHQEMVISVVEHHIEAVSKER